MGWNVIRLHGEKKIQSTHSLLVISRMTHETAWWRKSSMSPTYYWSWDEMQSGGMVKNAVLLTPCWSWDLEMQWDCMENRNVVWLTPCWSWDEYNETTGKEKGSSMTHILLVIGWNAMWLPGIEECAVWLTPCWPWDEMQWNCMVEEKAVSLTPCWSWDKIQWDCIKKEKNVTLALTPCWPWDEMQWDSMVKKKKKSVTHSLLMMGWNTMRMLGKEKKAMLLTNCWLAWVKH